MRLVVIELHRELAGELHDFRRGRFCVSRQKVAQSAVVLVLGLGPFVLPRARVLDVVALRQLIELLSSGLSYQGRIPVVSPKVLDVRPHARSSTQQHAAARSSTQQHAAASARGRATCSFSKFLSRSPMPSSAISSIASIFASCEQGKGSRVTKGGRDHVRARRRRRRRPGRRSPTHQPAEVASRCIAHCFQMRTSLIVAPLARLSPPLPLSASSSFLCFGSFSGASA